MCSRVRAPRPRATEVAVASIALLLLGLAIVFGASLPPRSSRIALGSTLCCIAASLLCCVIPTREPVPTGLNGTTFANNANPDLTDLSGDIGIQDRIRQSQHDRPPPRAGAGPSAAKYRAGV